MLGSGPETTIINWLKSIFKGLIRLSVCFANLRNWVQTPELVFKKKNKADYGWWGGSAGLGTMTWIPRLGPTLEQEYTPENCLLTSTHASVRAHTCTHTRFHTQAHTQIKIESCKARYASDPSPSAGKAEGRGLSWLSCGTLLKVVHWCVHAHRSTRARVHTLYLIWLTQQIL